MSRGVKNAACGALSLVSLVLCAFSSWVWIACLFAWRLDGAQNYDVSVRAFGATCILGLLCCLFAEGIE